MSLRKKVNLIIYRFREQGLEVFFVNKDDAESLNFPQGAMEEHSAHEDYITLDPVAQTEGGEQEEALAVEGDWHEIPSLKAMIYQDAVQLKEKLKEIEMGGFLTIKDALKGAMPHQYAFLKELKDILRDRNSVRDL